MSHPSLDSLALARPDGLPMPRLVPSTAAAGQGEARLLRLVERVRQDDVLAVEELYRLTRDEVARALVHLVGRRPDLEALVQETYERLLEAAPGARAEGQGRVLLYRACAEVATKHLRWWRRRRTPVAEPPTEAGTEGAVEAARRVHRALERLGAKKRIVFVFHELCGLDPEDIAQAVGASHNTVRARLEQARLEFTEALRALGTGARP